MIVQRLGRDERDLRQEVAHVLEGTMKALGQDVDLGAVARAEHNTLGNIGAQQQIVERFVEIIRGDSDLLEHIERRRGVIQTDDYKRHEAVSRLGRLGCPIGQGLF